MALGYEVYPSATNFLLVKAEKPEAVVEFLLLNGVKIRETSAYGLEGHLRISVGTPEANARLLELMGEYSKGVWERCGGHLGPGEPIDPRPYRSRFHPRSSNLAAGLYE